jgi:sulfite reductase (ferredoxin)
MADEPKLSHAEQLKAGSRQLRGTIAEELKNDLDHFSDDAAGLLKHHGSYQQENRDNRHAKDAEGKPLGKSYMFMVRTRIPGGKVSAKQFLAELDLCDQFANGTLRITTRQGFQLHGVLRSNLKETIREINRTKLSTISACGDVSRNVMCCPAPIKNDRLHDEMQALADRLAEHLKPKTTGYYEIWLEDETGEKTDVTEFKPVEEPIYGERYLPRKFKVAFAFAHDNCVEIYANDIGFMAIVEKGEIIGYNVVVGGSMGVKPSQKKTFPAVAKRMTFVRPDQVVDVATAIVKVQRDFGNREDRQQARMKYLVANWGIEKFKAKVEEYYGHPLPEPHPAEVTGASDHMGWHEQGDGNWYLGINIENGRIKDEGGLRIKTALRVILNRYGMDTRLTPRQGVILCDIAPKDRADIDKILKEHGIKSAEELTLARRFSIACPALPTCGLSVTESERVMPEVVDQIEEVMAEHGLSGERLAIHMTGCPNGCARPYTPDIGLVGKAKLKYTLFLGGNVEGTRIGFIYDDLVPLEEIGQRLDPLFAFFKSERQHGESFGNFCHRQGLETLKAYAESHAVP